MNSSKKKLKSIYICWQSLNNNQPTGMLKMLHPLFIYIKNKYGEQSELYIGYSVGKIKYEDVYSLGIINKWFVIVTNKIFSLTNSKRITYGSVRLMQEKLFDYLITKKIKNQFPIKLITTAYVPKAFEVNKKLGGINIYLPSTPCDVKIYELLAREKQKYDFPVSDAYFDKKRVDFIKKGVGLSDLICAPNELVENTFRETYQNINIKNSNYSLVISEKWEYKQSLEIPKRVDFFYCAHTTWLKGIFYLLEAWVILKDKKIINLGKLNIVGNFSPNLKNYIDKNFVLLSDVIIWGPLNNAENIAKQCQIGIVPSLLDSNPQTIFECMASGLPVIATKTCGNSRYIKNRINGSIINACDSLELAEEMAWYCSNINSWPLLTKAANDTYNYFGKNIDFDQLSSEIKNFS